jgi:hypothetical protein
MDQTWKKREKRGENETEKFKINDSFKENVGFEKLPTKYYKAHERIILKIPSTKEPNKNISLLGKPLPRINPDWKLKTCSHHVIVQTSLESLLYS